MALVFLCAALALAAPVIIAGPLTHGSFWIDYVWAKQFTEQIASGVPYPRWLPDSFAGQGAPVFYFYAPLSFFMVAVFGLIGFSTWGSIVAAAVFFHAASGMAMRHWLQPWGDRPALIGALVYMALPYHLIDFQRRGALAEFAAYALVPLVMAGVREAVEDRQPALLAVAYAALITTHLPMALLVSVFLVPAAFFYSRRGSWIAPAVGGIVGLLLASAYLVPAIALQGHVVESALWGRHFSPPHWILINAWNWPERRETLLIAAAILLSAGAAIVLLWRRLSYWPAVTIGLCVVAGNLIPFLWSIPLLAKVQFPWRAMALIDFTLATSMAIAISEGRAKRMIWLAPIAVLSVAVLVLPMPVGPTIASLDLTMPDVEEYRIGVEIVAAAANLVVVGQMMSLAGLIALLSMAAQQVKGTQRGHAPPGEHPTG
ncbi:MAG: hypothetical protein V4696_00770 [Pseudomonadota bacterium]